MADQNNITNPPEIPEGFCQCGCGQKVPPYKSSNSHYGIVKGQPHKFIHGHNSRGANNPMWGKGLKQAENPNWKGGRRIDSAGYILVHKPDHPFCNKSGCVREHILVIEKAFGRHLRPEECIHHIDEDKSNNHIGNLMVFATKAMHNAYHARLRAFKATGHWDWLKCYICKQYDHPDNIVEYRPNAYRHARCILDYNEELTTKKKLALVAISRLFDEKP